MSELGTIRRYSYWSDRRIRSIAADNSISLERRWLLSVTSPALFHFIPQAVMTEERRTGERHQIALKLERAIGQLAVEDFVTPPPAQFVKGCSPVTITAYTRPTAYTKSELQGVIIHGRTESSIGSHVEVFLFGSIENCGGYLTTSDLEAPIWSASSGWAIEEFVRHRGIEAHRLTRDPESIGIAIARIFNYEIAARPNAFKQISSGEWFAEVYYDVEINKTHWDRQRDQTLPPLPIDRIIIGAPLWVRSRTA